MSYLAPSSRRTSAGIFKVTRWLLPLLALNVTFTSKPIFPDAELARLFSLLFMLSVGYVFYRSVANRALALGILSLLLALRCVDSIASPMEGGRDLL